MLSPFKTCSDWFMDYHSLVLDEKYILVGKNGETVKYIYIPDRAHRRTDEEIRDFFTGLILKTDVKDDPGFTLSLLRMIKNPDAALTALFDKICGNRDGEENGIEAGAAADGEKLRGTEGNRDAYGAAGMSGPGAFRTEKTAAFGVEKLTAGPAAFRTEKAAELWRLTAGEKVLPAARETAGTETGAATAARREGAENSTPEFGKRDEEKRLIGNLFGEPEDAGEPKGKKKKEKIKKEKEKKERDKKEKKEKGGGFFGLFKGKGQKGEPFGEGGQPGAREGEENAAGGRDKGWGIPAFGGGTAAFQEGEGFHAGSRPEGGMNGRGRAYSPAASEPFVQPFAEDETAVAGFEEEKDGNVLRLRLEDSIGCVCPEWVELDIRRGFATVGRMNKNGEPQADYNFDASLSFVSRRHFRVEREGERYCIIDLGSTNGTVLNGAALPANMPYPLSQGDQIVISGNRRRLSYRVC